MKRKGSAEEGKQRFDHKRKRFVSGALPRRFRYVNHRRGVDNIVVAGSRAEKRAVPTTTFNASRAGPQLVRTTDEFGGVRERWVDDSNRGHRTRKDALHG